MKKREPVKISDIMISKIEEKEKGENHMSVKRTKYDEEFKKNAVKLSYASPKSIRQGVSYDCRSHPPQSTQ